VPRGEGEIPQLAGWDHRAVEQAQFGQQAELGQGGLAEPRRLQHLSVVVEKVAHVTRRMSQRDHQRCAGGMSQPTGKYGDARPAPRPTMVHVRDPAMYQGFDVVSNMSGWTTANPREGLRQRVGPCQVGIETSLPLLDLANEKVHGPVTDPEDGIGLGAPSVPPPDPTGIGKPKRDQVDIRYRLPRVGPRPAGDRKLGDGQVSIQLQIRLDQSNSRVHSLTALLIPDILLRVGIELFPASIRAEMIRPTLVLDLCDCLFRWKRHSADYIGYFHFFLLCMLSINDDTATEHPHLAGEGELPLLGGEKLHGHFLSLGQ